MRVLIAGCGDVGTRTALSLAGQGREVFGLRRDPTGLPPAIAPVAADLTDPASLRAIPSGLTHVLYAASADGRDEDRYRAAYIDGMRNVLELLADRGETPRLVFTSSTAVYGQDDGSWVDEDSPTEPGRFSGEVLLEAEALVRTVDGVTLRLAGIYGPGRTRLIDTVRDGEAVCVEGPAAYTNRIHANDCASAAAHLLTLADPATVYLGVDDDPAPRCEVLTWLAGQLGVEPPPTVGAQQAPGRRGGNKRCRNDRLRASGWRPTYPSFRDGYAALLAGA